MSDKNYPPNYKVKTTVSANKMRVNFTCIISINVLGYTDISQIIYRYSNRLVPDNTAHKGTSKCHKTNENHPFCGTHFSVNIWN